jgi:hypothetical protein
MNLGSFCFFCLLFLFEFKLPAAWQQEEEASKRRRRNEVKLKKEKPAQACSKIPAKGRPGLRWYRIALIQKPRILE